MTHSQFTKHHQTALIQSSAKHNKHCSSTRTNLLVNKRLIVKN